MALIAPAHQYYYGSFFSGDRLGLLICLFSLFRSQSELVTIFLLLERLLNA